MNRKFPIEIIELRKKNGIPQSTFSNRVYRKGMTPYEAATKPLEPYYNPEFRKWAKIAKTNGIKYETFGTRIRGYGWDYEKAATTPTQRGKYDKWVEKAKQHGISYAVFRSRLQRGWDYETASTKPVMKTKTKKELYKYAIYQGGEKLCEGSASECAKTLGIKESTIYWMSTPAYQRRIEESQTQHKSKVAFKVGVIHES